MSPFILRPTRPLRLVVTALMLAMAANAADAQSVFRCGPEGREIQQHPCGTPAPAGAGATEPSAADRTAAIARAKKDAETADRMERDRLAREREEAKHAAPAVGIGGSSSKTAKEQPKADPKHASTKKPKPSKHASTGYKPGPATGDFAAISPGSPAKAKKR